MKVEIYNRLMAAQMSRRRMLRGAASAGAIVGATARGVRTLPTFLFRGFLNPWEAYTGAKINWIDLAQADYNARLQQSIATGTVDFDIIEMGAPFEGDVCGKGLASVMPDWVKDQIDMDDYVGYLQAPVGTWEGKTYRISIDGDCHNFNYRSDYFEDADLAPAWKAEGHESPGE